jgi:hypothetical protein
MVYVDCPQMLMRRGAAFRKGRENVQDCFYRICTIPRPVGPPDRRDRPAADDECPRGDSQRRLALFRALKTYLSNPRDRPSFTSSQTYGPGFGAIFFGAFMNRILLHLRQIGLGAIRPGVIVCTLAYRIPICAGWRTERGMGDNQAASFGMAGPQDRQYLREYDQGSVVLPEI